VKPISLFALVCIFFSLFITTNSSAEEKQLAEGVTNSSSTDIVKYTNEDALSISQAAIGKTIGNYRFTATSGEVVTTQSFKGKPLIISLIYTSCYHICPTTTENLNRVVKKAKDVLGDNSFNVLTIGFDTHRDTPVAMAQFAELHSTESDNWQFLSTDVTTMKALVRDLGFIFTAAPHGFDHIIQASVLDKDSVLYRQVYGLTPQTPHFVEPLKELVFGEQKEHSFLAAFTTKIKLFCTVYDPAQDKYYFNYSIFVGVFVGLVMGIFFLRLFIREWRYTKNKSKD